MWEGEAMIIDTHIHESKYSSDSHMSLDEVIATAKDRKLDGVCITNHDNNRLRHEIGESAVIDGLLVIVGAEILTKQGDILVYGLDDIPDYRIESADLVRKVKMAGGVTASAHPFRTNNRGLKDYIKEVSGDLTAVESFNGSTHPHHNLYAYALATECNMPSMGASDAHVTKQIGCYATKFDGTIRDHKDFIEAVKLGGFCPVKRESGVYREINVYSAQKGA
ncbi:PHP-associated domain-containing protein [Andreesenia angusta]|nr:PHP domain-containing protein [Andreesenia angusta]